MAPDRIAISDRVTPLLQSKHRVVMWTCSRRIPIGDALLLQAVASALTHPDREKIKKAVLVGHSYGAYVALEEAAGHLRGLRRRADDCPPTSWLTGADRESRGSPARPLPAPVAGVFQQMTRDSSRMDSVVAKAENVPRDTERVLPRVLTMT
jgi:pimeloyl-ACP methyl ester carboxylesterase